MVAPEGLLGAMSVEDEFESLLSNARILFEQGYPQKSLELCQKALGIKECPKLIKKIERIKGYIASQEKENVNLQNEEPPSDPVEEVATHLFLEAREKFNLGDLEEALRLLKESYECVPSKKTAKKIAKIEEALGIVHTQTPDEMSKHSGSKVIDPNQMIEEARQLYHDGKLRQCIQLLYEVQKVAPSDKIQRKIERIEAFLNQNNSDSPANSTEHSPSKELVALDEGFSLPRTLYEKLYPYQQEGVRWLWKLHNTAPGGVLADDMGLGKTVQVIAFLCGLFLSKRKAFTALIVMPVSVLVTWESELKHWTPALRVCVFHDANRQTRLRYLASVQRQGGILLTTYGMVASSVADLTTDMNADPQFLRASNRTAPDERHGPEFQWNYLVLDEAHKIKNPAAKTTKAIMAVSAKHRILLTGTAVQNNLRELWSLYNCTHTGRLLGRMQTFKMEYEKPITRAREKDANRAERAHGLLMAQSLRKLIDPYFLRRTKAEVLHSSHSPSDQLEASMSKLATLQLNEMPKKTELVVWLYLRAIQERTYRDFLQLDQVKELLMRSNRRSPLMELVILKKLCDHPRLLSRDQCLSLNLDVNQSPGGQFSKYHLPSASQLMEESVKLYFLSVLMNSFLSDAEQESPYPPRTLIFSQSIRLLDMAEKVILSLNKRSENVAKSRGHRVLRLDGRLNKVEERLKVIQLFERDKSYTAMLLTTQVGGVGLTLTAANRVIILDPSWNPATDAQAVDRAYRIGQKSNVLVYRLITCATVEEKIYRRQIFKDSVIRQTTSSGRNKSDHDPYRYFTHQDLRELFTLSDPRVSTTQEQLSQLHEAMEKWDDPWLKPHLTYLTGDEMHDLVFGLSFHDLMFSRQEVHEPQHPTTADEAMREQELLRNRMAAAEYAIARECADLPGSAIRAEIPNIQTNPAFRPPDGVFLVPSLTDSRRPMLNRPYLGVPATHPPMTQTTIPHMMKPVVESTQPEEVMNITDHLTVSLREMSISQAATPPKMLNTSSADQGDSAPCVILSDFQDSPAKSPASTPCDADKSNPEHNSPQNISVVSQQHGATTAERSDSPPPSPAHSIRTPSRRSTSLRSSLAVDSPLPSSATFLGAVKDNVFRSTPVSAKTVPKPVILGALLANSKQPIETPCSSNSRTSARTSKPIRSRQAPSPGTPSASPSSSAPSSSNSNDSTGTGMLMDITADMDDEQLHQTVDMKSVHEILAKSGLLAPTEHTSDDDFPSPGRKLAETIAVEDSCLSPSQSSVNRMQSSEIVDSLDGVEIIEDSLAE